MKARTMMSAVALVVALSMQAAWACACGCAAKKTEAKSDVAKATCATKCATKSACTKKSACATKCAKKSACATKSSCTKGVCTKGDAAAMYKTIDTKGLKAAMAGKNLVLLDARSGKYDDGRRIPGAKQLAANADDKTIASVVGADKNAKIITYCSNTKCPAGAMLAKRLMKAGYTNVSKYPVGIAGWVEGGNKVNKN